jgi:hypothetical protein
VTYPESWAVTKGDENKLKTFEGKMLRKLWADNDNGEWRVRCNHVLHLLVGESDVIKVITGRRLRWLAHLCGIIYV